MAFLRIAAFGGFALCAAAAFLLQVAIGRYNGQIEAGKDPETAEKKLAAAEKRVRAAAIAAVVCLAVAIGAGAILAHSA